MVPRPSLGQLGLKHIYGAANEEGSTRSLAKSVLGTKDLSSRWSYLIDEYGAKVFVTDHLQQYSFEGEIVSDYEKQIRTISAVSDTVAARQIVCLLLSKSHSHPNVKPHPAPASTQPRAAESGSRVYIHHLSELRER